MFHRGTVVALVLGVYVDGGAGKQMVVYTTTKLWRKSKERRFGCIPCCAFHEYVNIGRAQYLCVSATYISFCAFDDLFKLRSLDGLVGGSAMAIYKMRSLLLRYDVPCEHCWLRGAEKQKYRCVSRPPTRGVVDTISMRWKISLARQKKGRVWCV